MQFTSFDGYAFFFQVNFVSLIWAKGYFFVLGNNSVTDYFPFEHAMTAADEINVKSLELTFRPEDRLHLSLYFGLADSVAAILGKHCEVVIHSLEDFSNSIVKIVNGSLSMRDIGAPITDMGLKILKDFLVTGRREPRTYFTRSRNGGSVKSSTVLLFGPAGNPIGMFCINVDLSAPFSDFAENFLSSAGTFSTESEAFGINTNDVIERTLEETVSQVNADRSVPQRLRNKTIVQQLYQSGIFDLKGAVKTVAAHLEITEHSVYKYVRAIQNSSAPADHS